MNKFKFYKEKKNKPESRIGQRTWEYQKTRDNVAKVLTEDTTYEEKMVAYIDYIIEKTFSLEPLSKRDLRRREDALAYHFISKRDKEHMMERIKDNLRVYADRINDDVENKWRAPNPKDLKTYIAGKQLLNDFIDKQNISREDIYEIPSLGPHVKSFAHKIGIDLDDSILDCKYRHK